MDYLIGEIILGNWRNAPEGMFLCNGATLPIQNYQALFSLIGTTYGGNGQTNFNLPNLSAPVASNQSDTNMIPRYYIVAEGIYPNLNY